MPYALSLKPPLGMRASKRRRARGALPIRRAAPSCGATVSGLRYYSPSQGRFLGRDPKEEDGGLNLYGFCGNNAINRWDYLGMDWTTVWGWTGTPDPSWTNYGGATYVDTATQTQYNRAAQPRDTLEDGGDVIGNGQMSTTTFSDPNQDVTAYLMNQNATFAAMDAYSAAVNWAAIGARTTNNGPVTMLPTVYVSAKRGGDLTDATYLAGLVQLSDYLSVSNYQALAAQIGWNGFGANLSPDQQTYYGRTAAKILSMQQQGKDVSKLWACVVGDVNGLIADSNGNIAGDSANLAKAKWLIGVGALGAGVIIPTAAQLAKRLGTDDIHGVKSDILNDLNDLKLLGKNPDIGIDDMGNIVLRSRVNGKTINTKVPIDSYGPGDKPGP